MSTLLLIIFSGFLLALMVWLRWTGSTAPNADLLLEAMRDSLEEHHDSEGRNP